MKRAGKRILVVEDEAVMRDLVVRVLSEEGYLVDGAANGGVAKEKLAQKSYDLCLIDLKMPVVGGKELYTFIEAQYPELEKRVVFSTGDTSSRNSLSFLKLTGRPRLVKPFGVNELRKIVAEAIEALSGKDEVEQYL